MGRLVTFQKRQPTGAVLNVVISLDEGETAKDAVECLRASREDWREFNCSVEWDVQFAINDARTPEAKPLAKYAGQEVPPKALNEHYRHSILDPNAVEPHIPHNYVTGVGDCLDYLDKETRVLIGAAIDEFDNDVGDEFGSFYCDLDAVESKRARHIYGRRREAYEAYLNG